MPFGRSKVSLLVTKRLSTFPTVSSEPLCMEYAEVLFVAHTQSTMMLIAE